MSQMPLAEEEQSFPILSEILYSPVLPQQRRSCKIPRYSVQLCKVSFITSSSSASSAILFQVSVVDVSKMEEEVNKGFYRRDRASDTAGEAGKDIRWCKAFCLEPDEQRDSGARGFVNRRMCF
ncbi:hypothetical protein MHYP_G00313800 [Metynnis hypsauchen]